MKPVLCVMGPTASGKSTLALHLAHALPCDIVSVDSAQVYVGLDIGTAKPDAATLAEIPHRLIDIVDPAERYSAARFREDALAAIRDIVNAGRIPLLTGGTMLYFRALLYGLAEMPAADPEIRAIIDARAVRDGWEALHTELERIDPAAAARIHANDPQRIQRALEVWELTGRTITELQSERPAPFPYRVHKLAIAPHDRAELHRKIERRLHHMMEKGFLDEVRGLRARGDLDSGLPSMRSVGYRQLWEHLDGRCALDESVRRAIHASRQLAKRQLTWLRREPGLEWLDPAEPDWLERGRAWAQAALQ